MSPRPLTDREDAALQREFLSDDLGRRVGADGRVVRRPTSGPEAPVTRIARDFTRTLYGLAQRTQHPAAALATEATLVGVVTLMDQLVVTWGRRGSPTSPLTVDGIRTVARIVAACGDRVGLTMPPAPSLEPAAAAGPQPSECLNCAATKVECLEVSGCCDRCDHRDDDPAGDDLGPDVSTFASSLFDPPGGTR